MAKNKEEEACYKAEGLRRIKVRKAQRIINLQLKQDRRMDSPWPDENSPTGWSQLCDYQPMSCFGRATCQYPCNGDC